MSFFNAGLNALDSLRGAALAGTAGHLWTKTALTPALVSSATYVAALNLSGKLIDPKVDRLTLKNYSKSVILNPRIVCCHLIGAIAATFITPKITQRFFDKAVSLNESFALARVSFIVNYIPLACIASTSLLLDKSKK
ncbi:MAG: hypothetical protein HRU43_02310 [Simkaniaceae bacterium]|nr:hypothetical protein [Simkaniaceae bacterium]